jgi:hypothetical protein
MSDQGRAVTPSGPSGPEHGHRHRLLRYWIGSFLIFFCLAGAWSFAQPIGAANDEPAQLIKAASVARGEILGSSITPAVLARLSPANRTALRYCEYVASVQRCNAALTAVTVPQSFATYVAPTCDTALQEYPAGCGYGLSGSQRPTLVTDYVGRYPPLYYGIVGLPSLVLENDAAVYAMRLMSGALSAALLGLALAIAAVWSRSRLLVAAVAVSATPMVFIFGSVVNSSGLEVAAAVCVWTGGLMLVLDRSADPPPGLVAATAGSAVVMVLSRGLSPLWLVLIGGSLVALSPRAVVALSHAHAVRVGVAAVAAAGVLAVGFIAWAHSLNVYPVGTPVPAGSSKVAIVRLVLGRSALLARELVGTFGWAETSPPPAVLLLWTASAATLLVLGLIASRRRHIAVLTALVLGSVLIPAALMFSQATKDGVVWQARDGFPLYVGVLLTAGAVVGRTTLLSGVDTSLLRALRSLAFRLTLIVAAFVAAIQFGDYFWALRRYAVGLGSTLNPLARVRSGWAPPVAPLILLTLVAAVSIAYAFWIVHLERRSPASRPLSPPGPSTDRVASPPVAPSGVSSETIGVGGPDRW